MESRQTSAVFLVIGVILGLGAGLMLQMIPAPPQKLLTEEIQERGTIRVGTNTSYTPFIMYNTTTSEFYGFEVDLCDMIADELGVTVEWIDMDFGLLAEACKEGTVDMIAAAISLTPDFADELAHSIPHIRMNKVIAVRGNSTLSVTDFLDLVNLQVGVRTGSVQDNEISALVDFGVNITIHRMAEAESLIAELVAGNLDAVYTDEPVLSVYSKTHDVRGIYSVSAPPTAFFCRKEERDLMEQINNVIMVAYNDGDIDALVGKWFT